MRHTGLKRLAALCLSVLMAAAQAVPAAAEPIDYTLEEGVTHQIYWLEGLEAPALSGDAAEFAFQQITLGKTQADVLITDGGKGWYDLSQDPEEEPDQSPAAAAANLLYWWLDQNASYVDAYGKTKPIQGEGLADLTGLSALLTAPDSNLTVDSLLYQQLGDGTDATASYLMDAFLNGYDLSSDTPVETGGFFYPVFGKTPLTAEETASAAAIKEALEAGKGMVAVLKFGEEDFHPVTVWGAELTEDEELAALYVTDSQDQLGMVRYDMASLENAGITVESLHSLSLGTDTWEAYEPQQEKPQQAEPFEQEPAPVIVWGEPEYRWSDAHDACTAVRTEKDNPDNVQTVEATSVTSEIAVNPTCTEPGKTTYTAHFEEEWADGYEETFQDLEALGHSWGAPSYEWSQDYSRCTATRVCANDASHVETIQGTIRKKESNRGRTVTYTAKFQDNWADAQTHVEESAAPAEPDWGEPTYEWKEDLSGCVATRVDRNDPSNVETAKARVSAAVTTKPNCTRKGKTTYTAQFQVDWAQTQTQVLENLDKLEPDWGETTYQWSEDHHRCVATRKCRNEEDHVETDRGDVTATPNKKPTTTQKGQTKYVAEFHVSWAETQTEIVEDIDMVEDRWQETKYTWSSDNQKCTASRVNRADSGIKETAEAQVSAKRTKEPTATQKGETTYTAVFDVDWAEKQTKTVANIPATGGQKPTDSSGWNVPVYEWSQDFSRCTARRSKKNDPSTVETARATVTKKVVQEPTCAVNGEAQYTAKFAESWAKDQTTKGRIPPLDHELKKVEESASTASHQGMKAHYECQVCHKLFLDAKGKKEVSREDLMLEKPSVSEGFAIVNAIPEKDNLVSVAPEKLSQALDQNPGAKGVSIAVGQVTVTYDKVDVQSILRQAKGAGKLQLLVYKTNAADSKLTLEQVQAMERNETGSFYRVELSYVQNGKSTPVKDLTGTRITVPYGGTGTAGAWEIGQDGAFTEVISSARQGFVELRSDNGLYMLSEQQPVTGENRKSGGKVGMIIWIVVLVVSGLACLGVGGFFLYQKMQEKQNDFEEDSFPRIDRNKPAGKSYPWDPEPNPAAGKPGKAAGTNRPQAPVSYDTVAAGQAAAPATGAPEAEAPELRYETVPSYQGRYSGAEQIPQEAEGEDDFIHDAELNDLLSQVDSVIAEPKAPVSPTAPKAPMEKKPTIAQKKAEAANRDRHF